MQYLNVRLLFLQFPGATISLQTASLSITEGNETTTETLSFCVVLEDIMDGLDREVEVNLTINTDTAGEQYPYKGASCAQEGQYRLLHCMGSSY